MLKQIIYKLLIFLIRILGLEPQSKFMDMLKILEKIFTEKALELMSYWETDDIIPYKGHVKDFFKGAVLDTQNIPETLEFTVSKRRFRIVSHYREAFNSRLYIKTYEYVPDEEDNTKMKTVEILEMRLLYEFNEKFSFCEEPKLFTPSFPYNVNITGAFAKLYTIRLFEYLSCESSTFQP